MTMKVKRLSVAEYISNQIVMSGKSQREIAEDVGYPKANVITMIKQGLTKLPVNKVPLFAKSLGVDPIHMLRITMGEYMPETWKAVEDVLGKQLVSENEFKIIEAIRSRGGGMDIIPTTKEDIDEFSALLDKWRDRANKLADASKRRAEREKSA